MKLIDISTPKFPNTFAKVDDEDFGFLNQWKWHPHGKSESYACRWDYSLGMPGVFVQMHRLILEAKTGELVDHINGDKFDNRRENLRICTNSQNQMNRKKSSGSNSKYKGVHWCKKHKKYIAQSKCNGTTKRIGAFSSEIEAAKAYNLYALAHHGEFARLNDIEVAE